MNNLNISGSLLVLIGVTFGGASVAKQIAPSCEEMIKDGPAVHAQWEDLLDTIDRDGFSVAQLSRALSALSELEPTNESQAKAKRYFIDKMQKPLMLLSDSPDAQVIRHNFRESLLKINDNLAEVVSSGDEPFTPYELSEALQWVEVKQQELKTLENIDLSSAMTQSRELDIDGIISVLKTAISFANGTNDESGNMRRMRFFELQRALSTSDNLIENKCRIWEVLR